MSTGLEVRLVAVVDENRYSTFTFCFNGGNSSVEEKLVFGVPQEELLNQVDGGVDAVISHDVAKKVASRCDSLLTEEDTIKLKTLFMVALSDMFKTL